MGDVSIRGPPLPSRFPTMRRDHKKPGCPFCVATQRMKGDIAMNPSDEEFDLLSPEKTTTLSRKKQRALQELREQTQDQVYLYLTLYGEKFMDDELHVLYALHVIERAHVWDITASVATTLALPFFEAYPCTRGVIISPEKKGTMTYTLYLCDLLGIAIWGNSQKFMEVIEVL
jgi:hypothetical protein